MVPLALTQANERTKDSSPPTISPKPLSPLSSKSICPLASQHGGVQMNPRLMSPRSSSDGALIKQKPIPHSSSVGTIPTAPPPPPPPPQPVTRRLPTLSIYDNIRNSTHSMYDNVSDGEDDSSFSRSREM